MALVAVQRSPSASSSPPSSEYGSSIYSEEDQLINRSLSEYYFAVKGFAVLLPKNDCQQLGRRKRLAVPPPTDIQGHLQAILHLFRPGDTLQMAVRLESFHTGRIRYLVVTTTLGRQDNEESCLLGVDFSGSTPSVGFVLAILADTRISLDGDGGFSVSTAGRNHIFKPVSVQAMWSALQTLHKESAKARDYHYFQGGLNHDWVDFYGKCVSSDQSCVNEWNAMDSLESKRPPSPDSLTNQEEIQLLIRSKLKEVMMTVDIDEVTSKSIRQRLESDLRMDLFKYKSFLDEEMLIILGQMDSATEIFPHVFLGSEWNASNLEELKKNGVGFILNVTKEIDNFFPGMFDYLNIRVYDDEKTELLRHWDNTYKYITQAKEKKSKVLVHCKMGISRSASVVIAYAMKAHNLSLDEATKLVSTKRTCIKPNQAFTQQLKIYQGILDASRQRHNALWRSKSETNLKSPSASCSKSKDLIRVSRRSTLRSSPLARGIEIPPFRGVKTTSHGTDELDSSYLAFDDDSQQEDNGEVFASTSIDKSLLMVPHALHSRRPLSWSPDDDTVSILFAEPFKEITNFGESIQKSRSLNDQTWQAHVTVEQRDLRDPGGGISNIDGVERPVLIEAYNPIYVAQSTPSSPSQQHDEIQLSSSVKERISEFESVQSSGANANSSNGNSFKVSELKSPTLLAKKISPTSVIIDSATTDASSDFENETNSTYLDNIIETLLTPLVDEKNEDSKSSQNSPQAIADPLSATLPETSVKQISSPTSEPVEIREPSVVIVPNESITWAVGIVRKQKEDFEGKVKDHESISRSCEKLRDSGDSLCNLSRLTRSASSVSASEASRSIASAELLKKDDPLSTCLDNWFDREEKKLTRQSMVPDLRESPSRNNSWGSFDSAVVLMDRELPSRQSSWGSCDTRFSVGSIPSRNSSFGAFDSKNSNSKFNNLQSNISFTCFDKESGIFSPSTIRRNKINEGSTTSLIHESKCTTESASEISNKNKDEDLSKLGLNANIENKPDNLPVLDSKENCSQRDRAILKHSPQSPEHEIPLPGTVKQQKEKLESCNKSSNTEKSLLDNSNANLPSFVRSLSSGSVDARGQTMRKGYIIRSFSEKRRRADLNPAGGKVKKITRALENQNVTLVSYSSQLGNKNPLRTIKDCLARQKDASKFRSMSLERLSSPSSVDGSQQECPSSVDPLHPECPLTAKTSDDIHSSQNLLGQLVNEAQAQVKELEADTEEEKCVKDIVFMFEETNSDRETATEAKKAQSPPCSFRISRHKGRPHSESIGILPPVPQRKSSLDHNFFPVKTNTSQHPQIGSPLRQSLSWSSTSKAKESQVTSNFYYCISHQRSLSSPPSRRAPSQSPSGSSYPCALEVRQTKQQGKSHPLSKLAPRENTL